MRRHHDENHVYKLLGAREVARMVLADPRLLDEARRANRRRAGRPHAGDAVALWDELLEGPVAGVAEALGRDDEEGDRVRGAMPGFVVVEPSTRARLIALANRLLAEGRAGARGDP